MEDDATVKAPVTRLRRRLSVELADDSRSPSAPSTPTKKRGGRLATKPQLELIDENASDSGSKRGAKKITPKEIEEEKPVTPSRRSARIKSNTSIVADTPQACDSPRAKRAARRNSQIGSDNETPLTPARQTRRTRKDSTSSIDKQDAVGNSKSVSITPIVEEKETINKGSKNDVEDEKNNKPLRKSPRNKKKNELDKNDDNIKQSNNELPVDGDTTLHNNMKPENDQIMLNQNNSVNNTNKQSTLNKSSEFSINNQFYHDKENNQINIVSNNEDNDKTKLSESNANLINDLNLEPKRAVSNINKSTSSIENLNNKKSMRHRTKSWTNSSQTPLVQDHIIFYSDSEKKNKKKDKHTDNSFKVLNISLKTDSSIDNILNITEQDCITNKSNILNTSSSKKKKRSSESSAILDNNTLVDEPNNKTNSVVKDSTIEKANKNNNEIDIKEIKDLQDDADPSDNLFKKGPTSVIQSIIYFEDSDTDNKEKTKKNKQSSDNEDQCVPVIDNNFEIESTSLERNDKNIDQETNENSFANKKNDIPYNTSCEPMDIDESIPNNISILNTSNKSQSKHNVEYNSEKISQDVKSLNNSANTSKITSMSLSKSNSLEKIDNENKSTLIISQLKDVSTTENNTTKSPKPPKIEILSKSFNNLEEKKNKKNISLDYSTSTPLQQKNLKKISMQINTSVINNSNTELKTDTANDRDTSKIETSVVKNKSQSLNSTQNESDSESEENSESEEKSDSHSSNIVKSMLYDEAEEASDDYESGDSRDDDERDYEIENEILERGETLESEDEITDSSNYEKDSFVVSSNEEDNDLLEGSGDDLSLSDNELTMSKKSKKKYNERKMKEQKKASKEMFEARHNISNNSAKSNEPKSKRKNRQRLDSTKSNSDEEIMTGSKKSKRNRLNSTLEKDADKSVDKKTKRLSESISNISTNKEIEVTISVESVIEQEDPLSILVKPEPKTPNKELNKSTVPVTENIEEVDIGNDFSMTKTNNESSDPLRNDELSDNESLLSENEEIRKKFDSVLKDLNNIKDNKLKMSDTSLNLNTKNKKKSNEPIVDQLNLTDTKKPKKNKKPQAITNIKDKLTENNVVHKNDIKDDDSSNSIDLQLLFSEDSMESVNKNTENKITHETNTSEEYIPAEKSQGKLDITKDKSVTLEHNKSLSKDKSKKRKSSLCSSNKDHTDDNEGVKEFPTFIDTIGAVDTSDTEYVGLNTSTKRKKNSISLPDSAQIIKKESKENAKNLFNSETKDSFINERTFLDTRMSLNTSAYKRKNLIKSLFGDFDEEGTEDNNAQNLSVNEAKDRSLNLSINTSAKKNKNRNKSLFGDFEEETTEKNISGSKSKGVSNKSLNMSLDTSSKNNKKKHSTSVLDNSQQIASEDTKDNSKNFSINEAKDTSHNMTLNTSAKKNKSRNKSLFGEATEEKKSDKSLNMSLDTSSKKNKKKHSSSVLNNSQQMAVEEDNQVELDASAVNVTLTSSKQNKKKHNLSVNNDSTRDLVEDQRDRSLGDEILNRSLNKKKKKQSLIANPEDINNNDDDPPLEVPFESHKIVQNAEGVEVAIDTKASREEDTLNSSLNSSFKKKKNQKSLPEVYLDNSIGSNKNKENSKSPKTTEDISTSNANKEREIESSKKRKRKLSASTHDEDVPKGGNTLGASDIHNESLTKNQKKKVKKSHKEHTNENQEITSKSVNKKRKERDDDEGQKTSKIFKKNSFDKNSVSRLPSSILNQLDDKPKKELLEKKKGKTVSTTQFKVEEIRKRRNKPSNYLEESVYLNDTHEEKKQTGNIKAPKVLPFVPTASTSGSGFTTKFQINVVSKETKFIAQTANITGFKNEYLYGKNIKRLGTYEMYKKQRNVKMSKF